MDGAGKRGGHAAMPLIQQRTVVVHGWLSLREFTDLVTIAEMTPGPIGINVATFVGTRTAGFPGALIATFGHILPAVCIVTLPVLPYNKYKFMPLLQGILATLRPVVPVLILCAGLSILRVMCLCGAANLILEQFS